MSVEGWEVTPFLTAIASTVKIGFLRVLALTPARVTILDARGNTVVESGAFTANVKVQTQTLEREAIRSFEQFCPTGSSLDRCKRAIAIREVKHCPYDRTNEFFPFQLVAGRC
jgi:hypothetical protein